MDKVSWSAVKVVLALVACCCCLSPCSALISCYSCTGKIGENCALLNSVEKTANNSYCVMINSGDSVSRYGIPPDSNQAIQLRYTQYCDGVSCYCNTSDSCNSEKINSPTKTISCYVCSSLSYLDNGCGDGDLFDPKSAFMHKEESCTACYKVQDATSIQRGCIKSVHAVERCSRDLPGPSIHCVCTGDDCNHASSLLPAYTAIVISFIVKSLI